MTTNLETRVIRRPTELRAAKTDDGGDVFSGYIYLFDTISDDLGGFRETIKKGAAAKWLANPTKNVFAILDHEKEVRNVLGDLETNTLKLYEDNRGLAFEIYPGPTTAAKDAAVVVGRNKVGMSFAFVKGEDQWGTTPDGGRLRTLLEFEEFDDISIVVDAAYKSSDVTVAKRSLEAAIAAEKRTTQTPAIETRGAIGLSKGPTDDSGEWDGAAAEKRVRAWATDGDKVDFAKYRKAFTYVTGDGDKLGDFHLLIHDAKDGKLVLVWRAVTAAMAAVNGSRGGVKWEKASDKEAVYKVLSAAYKRFKQEPPELRAQPQTEKEVRTVDVELLKRDFELRMLEMRGVYPEGMGPMPDGDDRPKHPLDAAVAHQATRDAFRAKEQTGAPSRALELAAADAHDKAAKSAEDEGKPAAAQFHKAAAVMHRAASGDDYAGDFTRGYGMGYDCYRSTPGNPAVETRANPHHDEDGHFHDGSAKSILDAAAGRMKKAENRNADAVNAWKEAHDSFGDDHEFTAEAAEERAAAHKAHEEAITAAEGAVTDADAAHAKLVSEHRTACTESRSKLTALQNAIPNHAPTSGMGTDTPSSVGTAAAATGAPAE